MGGTPTAMNPSGAAGFQNVQAGGQTGFIGQSSQNNAQNVYASGQGARGAQNFNALTQLMTKARGNQFNQQQAQKNARTNQQAQSQFRVPLRLGFVPQPVNQGRIIGYEQRLTKIAGLSRLGPIQASLEGRTAVLRGTVASEADRQLAEGLARLEPEVMAVRNELVVGNSGNSGTTVEALPPASGSAR
jgi:BON domain